MQQSREGTGLVQNYLVARETKALSGAESRTTPTGNHRGRQRTLAGGTPQLPIHLPLGTCRPGPAAFTCGPSFTCSPRSRKGWQTSQMRILPKERISDSRTSFQVITDCIYFPLGETRHPGSHGRCQGSLQTHEGLSQRPARQSYTRLETVLKRVLKPPNVYLKKPTKHHSRPHTQLSAGQ